MSDKEVQEEESYEGNKNVVTTEEGGGEETSNEKNISQATASPTHSSNSKIDIFLRPAGDAPIMKKKRWLIDRNKRMSWIGEFIKKYLKIDAKDSLFLYVNQSFSPSPDTQVGAVFDCFESDGKLMLHYCRTQAWG